MPEFSSPWHLLSGNWELDVVSYPVPVKFCNSCPVGRECGLLSLRAPPQHTSTPIGCAYSTEVRPQAPGLKISLALAGELRCLNVSPQLGAPSVNCSPTCQVFISRLGLRSNSNEERSLLPFMDPNESLDCLRIGLTQGMASKDSIPSLTPFVPKIVPVLV